METEPKLANDLKSDPNVTEEEFQNFMHRVTQIEKIVAKLASSDPKEQNLGTLMADEILEAKSKMVDGDLTVKSNRTVINKLASNEETDPNRMSREAFMKSVERDAKKRAEDRKVRNERADTYKRIADRAYKEEDFEKAVTYYSKATEQRKDSTVLWNSRALSYIKLGLYEKALSDCGWALKINDTNVKALLNSAKCCNLLGRYETAREHICRAKESHPKLIDFIDEFVENMNTTSEGFLNQRSNCKQDISDDI